MAEELELRTPPAVTRSPRSMTALAALIVLKVQEAVLEWATLEEGVIEAEPVDVDDD